MQYTLNGITKNNKQTVTGIPAGTYTLHIFDVNGCTKDTFITIYEPAEFYADSLFIRNVTCNGMNDGMLGARGHKGTKPYTFVLEKGGVVQATRNSNDSVIFIGLVPGNDYQIEVFDKNSCNSDTFKNITIAEPAVLSIVEMKTTGYVCSVNDGSIVFQQVIGGTRPYQYSLDNGANWQTDSVFFNLMPAFPYNPMVKDSNNCTDTDASITLIQANLISIDSTVKTSATSCASADGKLKIYAQGGTGKFDFSIDNGTTWQLDSTFYNLKGGAYTVIVRDTVTKCTATKIDTIKNPSSVDINAVLPNPPTCYGSNEGRLIIIASGLTPLQYSIDGGVNFQNSNDFGTLYAGTYKIVVKDNFSCKDSTYRTLLDPAKIKITAETPYDVYTNLWSIKITDIQNVPANDTFRFGLNHSIWRDDSTFTGLNAGSYTITVIENKKNCQIDTVLTLSMSNTLNVLVTPLDNNIWCYNDIKGEIDFHVYDPMALAPFSYHITGPITTMNITDNDDTLNLKNLPGGTYYITVTDGNGLMFSSGPVLIRRPSPLDIVYDSYAGPTCSVLNNSTNGHISVSATGAQEAIDTYGAITNLLIPTKPG